jgi:hypothetical protein
MRSMLEPQSIETLALGTEETARLTEPFSNERLLTRIQVAEFLGVSPRTIDAWCANIRNRSRRRQNGGSRKGAQPSRDRLPYIKLGHKIFFQLGDVRRFRDERKVAA